MSGAEVTTAFFDELMFVIPEDRFFSTRTRELLSRSAVNFAWSAALARLLLPRITPSKWFSAPENTHRARMADLITYWPGMGRFFQDDHRHRLVNRWVAPDRVALGPDAAHLAEWLALIDLVTSREGPQAAGLLLDWMAFVVACPGKKPGWHVIVHGGQGIGKDLIAQPMIAGVGQANHGSTNATSLHSQFNAFAELRLVSVNELKRNARGADTSADQYNTLKELTENTNKRVRINQKNMKEYYARNVGAYYVTSNEDGALALDPDDRLTHPLIPYQQDSG